MTVLRSIDKVVEVIERVADAASSGRVDAAGGVASGSASRTIVGITGPPGAGKSTIAAEVVERLTNAALLPMDGYHLPQATLVVLGRRDRMGAPDTFDVDGFVQTLAEVHNSCQTVLAPGFDREIEEPVPDAIALQHELRTVVVEGNYLLHDAGGWERVASELDVTFFVQLDRDIRLSRLIERHIRFGKTPDAARAWSLGPDEANARLIETAASRATHLIRLD